MREFVINDGILTQYERHVLTIPQMFVLAILRQAGSRQQAAQFLNRDVKAIDMIVLRIRQQGIMVNEKPSLTPKELRDEKKKVKARALIQMAIKHGDIVVKPCMDCGRSAYLKDGRRAVEAHHPDYDRPLDVEWLCKKCHEKRPA